MTGTVPTDSTCFTVKTADGVLNFLKPSDPDGILDEISDEEYEKDQFLPYWAEYWPSSEALLSMLPTCPLPRNALIAEAGCGLGVISAWLSLRGYRVAPFDISPAACRYAQANISRFNPLATAICTDWRALPFRSELFDCIIAADVLYESRWINPVLSLCDRYLKKGAFALIADPCRGHWDSFKTHAVEYGFQLEIAASKTVNENKTTVEVLRLNKPATEGGRQKMEDGG